ncbi:MAG: winged helix-turn-helix domain-containing protein [Acidobacteria bacterium]|nr:winged helix-turn-helix domain-containing protein [Acidobacteriota bacterium]
MNDSTNSTATKIADRQLRFGEFELDPVSGELRKGEITMRLKPQPVRVLTLLARNAGRAVLREEIRNEIWGQETFVDFERGLNSCITQIRAALGDDADAPRYIETLPRRGYRFIAAVEPDEISSLPITETESVQPQKTRPWLWIAGPALALLVVTSIFLWPRSPKAAAPPLGKIKLVVLPFERLDGNAEEDYFGEGMTEELITQLASLQSQRLGVIARTSAMHYRKSSKTVREIGQELGVNYVLEGSIRSIDGVGGKQGRIRITAQLIQVNDQTHLWAETFERDAKDLVNVQAEVARKVAQSLAIELLPNREAAWARKTTANLVAHDAYLRGRHHLNQMNPKGFAQAVDDFSQSIGADPNFALAYAGLADAYNYQPWWGAMKPRDAYPKAAAAAEKALQLDSTLAEAHFSRGMTRMYFDWDFANAEKEFQRAIELSPGLAMAHYGNAGMLTYSGRHEEAIASIRRAQELDPLSALVNGDAGWYYIMAGKYDEGMRECRQTLEKNPDYMFGHQCLMVAYRMKGADAEALAEAKIMMASIPLDAETKKAMQTGNLGEALQTIAKWRLERMRQSSGSGSSLPYQEAILYTFLGRKDEAFHSLEKAIEFRDYGMVSLRVDRRLDPLRADPRFAGIMRKAGFK